MRPRPLRLFSTVPFVCLLSLLGFPDEGAPNEAGRSAERTESVHLVLDLGSSGTRFCMYPVTVMKGQEQKRCRVTSANPVCFKLSGGIAALVRGHSHDEVPSLILPKLRLAWEALGDPQKKGNPQVRDRIQGVVALGTGGFRSPSTNLPDERREFQAVWTEIARFFKEEAKQEQVVARTISGLEEARLAWLGVSQQIPATAERQLCDHRSRWCLDSVCHQRSQPRVPGSLRRQRVSGSGLRLSQVRAAAWSDRAWLRRLLPSRGPQAARWTGLYGVFAGQCVFGQLDKPARLSLFAASALRTRCAVAGHLRGLSVGATVGAQERAFL